MCTPACNCHLHPLPVCYVACSHPPTSVTTITCNICVHWPSAYLRCTRQYVTVFGCMAMVLELAFKSFWVHHYVSFSLSLSLTWSSFFFFHFLTDIKAASSTHDKHTALITNNIHITWTKANTFCSFCSHRPVILKSCECFFFFFFFFFLDVWCHNKYQTL
jgi:hypothetical protein